MSAQRKDKLLLALVVVLGMIVAFALGMDAGHAEDWLTVTVDGSLNVRAKPWTGADVLGYLFSGDTVEVLDTADGWVHVTAPIEAGEGWVKADYLSDDEAAEPWEMRATVDDLRVRTSPDKHASTARKLHKGATVTVSGTVTLDGTTWARVCDGYVMINFLEETANG